MCPILQSLILPFAYLMHEQSAVVMDLLESTSTEVKVEGGGEPRFVVKSGLEVFTRKWVADSETFQGFWAQRVRLVLPFPLALAYHNQLQCLTYALRLGLFLTLQHHCFDQALGIWEKYP